MVSPDPIRPYRAHHSHILFHSLSHTNSNTTKITTSDRHRLHFQDKCDERDLFSLHEWHFNFIPPFKVQRVQPFSKMFKTIEEFDSISFGNFNCMRLIQIIIDGVENESISIMVRTMRVVWPISHWLYYYPNGQGRPPSIQMSNFIFLTFCNSFETFPREN